MMHKSIEKLAYKISEAVQGDQLQDITDKLNIFHRKVSASPTTDLAFANGVVTSGLRAAALVSTDKNSGNYASFQSSLRQHLPVVLNLDNYNSQIRGFEALPCFIFVASSAQEHLNLNILAHKVAEMSLVPGLIIANYEDPGERLELPADELLKKYLGSPDDYIESPTPAQRLIFGLRRRRIPNWFNLDLPVMLGVDKDERAAAFEAMASEKYFNDHLQEIITRSIAEFKAVFSTDISPLETRGKKNTAAIISNNSLVLDAFEAAKDKHAALLVKLTQVKPFPKEEIGQILKKTKQVTVLEHTSLGGSSSFIYQKLRSLQQSGKIYAGRLGNSLSGETLAALTNHMHENKAPEEYFVELEFTKSKSPYPKHEILLQDINMQYPELRGETIGSPAKVRSKGGNMAHIPMAIREHLDKGPNYSKLSGFYDNIAFFYQQDEEDELVADPFAALPLAPAGSGGFFNSTTSRSFIPHFRPAKCTGCGDCFVECPHAALPPLVAGVEQLMKSGMDVAMAKGHKLLKLTPMLKNLAKLASNSISEKVESLEDFLPLAFDNLCSQMKLEGENLSAAKEEFELVMSELHALPVAITETFYNSPETAAKGTGEFFSVNFNPDTCTGCGICANACPDEAINMVEEDEEYVMAAREAIKLWETLPSASQETVSRIKDITTYNPLASILLPKENYNTMTGGSKNEAFNTYKSLIHLVTATAQDIVSPKRQESIAQVSALIESISESVHENLSNALPKENLEALSLTLKETRSQKTSFHEIVDRLEELGQQKMVDTKTLQRQTDLVDDLKELKWVLTTGPSGVGRAHYGLYLTDSEKLSWAQQYPLNNFAAPVVVQWQSSAPEQVLGLIHGHLRHQIDNLKLIRRAGLEAAGKYDPTAHDLEIATLDWDKLTLDERSTIPPVLLIGERNDINAAGWQSLNKLLESNLPLKVVLLDHIAPPSKNSIASLTQSYAGLLNAITLKKALVFQGSMSHPEHLAMGLAKGLAETKPALLNLYAFDEFAHKRDSTAAAYAQLAINSRTFPLLFINPDKEHGFLNGSIDLDANRDTREDWVSEDIPLPNEESLAYSITWADWAYTQDAWESEFKKVAEDGNNVPISEYLKLSTKDRAKKIPVISRATGKSLVYYSASRAVILMTEAVLNNWNTLQELAGLITEFPVKLSEEVKKELTAKFDEDIAALKKEYEQKMLEKEQEFMSKMRLQVRERLIQLSKMAKN